MIFGRAGGGGAGDPPPLATLAGQFNSGLDPVGIALDPTENELFIYGASNATVNRVSTTGTALGTFVRPGESSNDFDLDHADSPLALNGVAVPAGSVLAFNGELGTVDIYAVNPATGAIIATLATAFGANFVVGGAYHTARGTFFVLQAKQGSANGNMVAEINAQTGAVIQSFKIDSTGFTINFGDLEVDPFSGNLLLVSSDETAILRVSPQGALIDQIALPAGVTGTFSGIAMNPLVVGEAFIGTTQGNVYRLAGVDPGTAGNDVLTGSSLGDVLDGLSGDDIINGRGGADTLRGGTGNDIFGVDSAGDVVVELAGQGDDTVSASVGYTLAAGASVEAVSTASQAGTAAIALTGNEFAQSIFGNEGSNQLLGLGGNDQLTGYGGDDVLVGGGGIDYLRGGLGNDVYGIGEGDVILEVAGEGDDSLAADIGSYFLNDGASIETLSTANQAGTFAQNLTGNELGQSIAGSEGANVLNGMGGNDLLRGYGGADIFLFDTAPSAANHDVIADMAVGVDRIALQNSVFTGLAEGNLGAEAFRIGASAQDADDRIIWNAATNQLFFDADGNGAGAAVLFAIVNGSPNLQATDFMII